MNKKSKKVTKVKKVISDHSPVPTTALPIVSPRKQADKHPIALSIEQYIASMRRIGVTAKTVLPHITKWRLSEIDKHEKKMAKFIPGFPKIEHGARFKLGSAREYAEFIKTLRELSEIGGNRATTILARSLFMQMFSEFDAFIGYFLHAIYLRNDELFKGISREISLSDLMNFENLDAVKRSLLEKEIDGFRRDSYVEQFATLEKKFGLSLRKFPEWSEFVELSQRRNIFTHNGGLVSDQYLVMCEREGFVFVKRPKVGDNLSVNFDYFSRALILLSKVGLMLGFTLWGKIFPRELQEVHASFNDTLYSCLEGERWNFVAELSDFALSEPMRREITEVILRIRIINIAIGLKFSRQDDDARKLLSSVDWSAAYRDFKLAIAVLEEQYDEAITLMKEIGKTGEMVDQTAYHTWPLFTKLREQTEFYETYEKIYGETFAEQVKGGVDSAAEISVQPGLSTQSEDGDIEDVKAIRKSRPSKRKSTPKSKVVIDSHAESTSSQSGKRRHVAEKKK